MVVAQLFTSTALRDPLTGLTASATKVGLCSVQNQTLCTLQSSDPSLLEHADADQSQIACYLPRLASQNSISVMRAANPVALKYLGNQTGSPKSKRCTTTCPGCRLVSEIDESPTAVLHAILPAALRENTHKWGRRRCAGKEFCFGVPLVGDKPT